MHVYFRTRDRSTAFHSGAEFLCFRALLAAELHEHLIWIYHYCLMPNHVHLLVEMPEHEGFLIDRLGRTKQRFSRWLPRSLQWDTGFGSRVVRGERDYRGVAKYIEENPVRAGLVTTSVLWPHSSAGVYELGLEDPLVTRDWTYAKGCAVTRESLLRFQAAGDAYGDSLRRSDAWRSVQW